MDFALKKDGNYFPQVFWKGCNSNDNFSDFSSADESDEEKMFFDKSLSFLLFNVLLTRKYADKV